MKLRLLPLTLLILLVPTAAFAQTPVAPVQTLSTETMIIALLAVLSGYVTHSISTGLVFGIKTIPKPWLPYLGLFGAFLVPLTASIYAASSSPTGATQVAWFNALLAGLIGLGGFVSGVTGKQAIDAHTTTGKGDATTNKQADTAAASPPPQAPAAHRGMIRGALVGAVSALLVVALLMQPACKGSALPVAENIVAVVLADLQAGKSDSQIAADVCAALGGSSATDAVCSGAEQLVADVITYLVDSGTLSSSTLANAQAYQARHKAAH